MIDWNQYIQFSSGILYGKPVIVNTRISVDLILEKLASGDSPNDIMAAYPNVSHEAITVCLLFAADTIKNEIVHSRAS
jgi:uncharacterized protein (DUF433 family)